MSEMDEGFRLEMAEYIRQANELKAKLGVIEMNLEKPEAKLARAKAIILKAKAAYDQLKAEVQPLRSEKIMIEGELELLAEKKSTLRQEAAFAKAGGGVRPGTQAFVNQMTALTGDPEEAKTDKAVAQLDAAAALAELKAKMGQ